MKVEWTNRDNLSIETTSQNSKAILVIDMPDMCLNCDLYAFQSCYPLQRRIDRDGLKIVDKPEWCPLKLLPLKGTMENVDEC